MIIICHVGFILSSYFSPFIGSVPWGEGVNFVSQNVFLSGGEEGITVVGFHNKYQEIEIRDAPHANSSQESNSL